MTEIELRGHMESVIAETNLSLPREEQLGMSDESRLIGEGGVFDSLALITFLVGLESALASKTGQRLPIVDENELGRLDGAYRTVGSLVAFVSRLARKSGVLND